VYRSEAGGGEGTEFVASTTQPTITISDLIAGHQYDVYISKTNNVGETPTQNRTFKSVFTLPNAPADGPSLSGSSSPASRSFTWLHSAGTWYTAWGLSKKRYHGYIARTEQGPWFWLGEIIPVSSTANNNLGASGLFPNSQYCFRVSGEIDFGEGPAGPATCYSRPNNTPSESAPAAPTSLAHSQLSSTGFKISWSNDTSYASWRRRPEIGPANYNGGEPNYYRLGSSYQHEPRRD
jgi:hypothetical protein